MKPGKDGLVHRMAHDGRLVCGVVADRDGARKSTRRQDITCPDCIEVTTRARAAARARNLPPGGVS